MTIDEREILALERGTDMYKTCALNAEEALDEASMFSLSRDPRVILSHSSPIITAHATVIKRCLFVHLHGHHSLWVAQAKTLLSTYNKLVDRLIGQLVERMCQCRRSEDATRAAVALIRSDGTAEQKSALATQLRALPLAADYKVPHAPLLLPYLCVLLG